jgi:hypothetical protein
MIGRSSLSVCHLQISAPNLQKEFLYNLLIVLHSKQFYFRSNLILFNFQSHKVQTGAGAHPASYLMYGSTLHRGKAAGA